MYGIVLKMSLCINFGLGYMNKFSLLDIWNGCTFEQYGYHFGIIDLDNWGVSV